LLPSVILNQGQKYVIFFFDQKSQLEGIPGYE
jgi:hypothetical protein